MAAAAAARASFVALARRRLFPAAGGLRFPASPGAAAGLGASPGAVHPWPAFQSHSSQSTSAQERVLPKTSLTSPPWPKIILPDPKEETRHHREVLQRVNELIAAGQYGRLFAVVHFASRQWKVTDGDLILIENTLEAKCGERIRMEKVLPCPQCAPPSSPARRHATAPALVTRCTFTGRLQTCLTAGSAGPEQEGPCWKRG
ncbi:39S ribosomal protein L21, mitochondrial isoform X2 [Vombatus ursinus]|uniref:39S ribosomal protein L21, mitochondrial isoform X2 n=1 Tax=Vombatus ursinus TaxID=29139 RepID=UPI000FFD3F89|nr:39S ribosomal protein L21, mitochondrial isoform X2 [Vombatus ursinus]